MGRKVNNTFYETLGPDWYGATDHPVALLRSENCLRNRWIAEHIRDHCPETSDILDIGCGAGFLCNPLAQEGHRVCGLDLSVSSLTVARKNRADASVGPAVRYICGDCSSLPFAAGSFDAVCAMDVLEHVERPDRLVSESSRVLRPGGRFFFYTFNRNFLTWLIVIKGVEWFVRNTPPDMHVYRYFIKPAKMSAMLSGSGLKPDIWRGVRPRLNGAFWSLLATGRVRPDFEFCFTPSLAVGYFGVAIKVKKGGAGK
jgi:2-polyprenyl-6-hydroxyphenyl methylase / 3-demethylubiquinone-9 3-methyltransferase